MITHRHALPSSTPGVEHHLTSLHWGAPDAPGKAYIQAGLHADEWPGMLVAHVLRQRLDALEAQGRVAGRVVLVPVANPIGLAQSFLQIGVGRFEAGSGENFNRHYPDVTDAAAALAEPDLRAGDVRHNVGVVRAALRQATRNLPAVTPLQGLRRTLFGLACDADIVLDLHCDTESVLHVYTGTLLWPQAEPLCRLMGAEVTLLARESGDDPFDEACSSPWWKLAERWAGRFELPPACLAATVELRGVNDVDMATAQADADAIVDFLRYRGLVSTPDGGATRDLPPLKRDATPLAGSVSVTAPHAGLIVFHHAPGDEVRAGDAVADVIEPVTGQSTPVTTPIDGLLYARENHRFVAAGTRIAKIAGRAAVRTGKLLGP